MSQEACNDANMRLISLQLSEEKSVQRIEQPLAPKLRKGSPASPVQHSVLFSGSRRCALCARIN
jgi:hypothetical protein